MQNTFASQLNPRQNKQQDSTRGSGLSPIPIRPNSKTPCVRAWPTLKVRTLLQRFGQSEGNVGLRMGVQENGNAILRLSTSIPRTEARSKHSLRTDAGPRPRPAPSLPAAALTSCFDLPGTNGFALELD